MHHAEILIGRFGEMVGNWPVASCYFALCVPHAVWSGTTECVKGNQEWQSETFHWTFIFIRHSPDNGT